MIANQTLLRSTAVLSATSRRAFSTTVRAFNVTPQLKREGPTAHKGDKGKFDDGRKCFTMQSNYRLSVQCI